MKSKNNKTKTKFHEIDLSSPQDEGMKKFDLGQMDQEEEKLENEEEFDDTPFRSKSVVIDETMGSPGIPKRTSD